jgi:hypothetical protein
MSTDTDLFRLASELETRRAALLVAGDADGLTGLMSEHLYYAHSTGLLDDKRSFIAKFRDGTFAFRSVEARVESASPLGSQAFQANGVLDLHVRAHGVDRRILAIYMVVWRQEDGVWRLIGHQATTAPDLSQAQSCDHAYRHS